MKQEASESKAYGPTYKRILANATLVILLLATILPIIHLSVHALGPPYSWTGPTDIDSVLGQDVLPSALRLNNGTVIIAWQTYRFSSTRPDIMFKTYNGTDFGFDGRVTSTNYNTSPALAQLQDGTILIFWAQRQTVDLNIYYEKYSTTLNKFDPTTLTHATTTASYNDTSPAAIVGPSGALWLFWARTNQTCTTTCNQTKQVYYKTLTQNVWSTETQLTNDANWNWMPSATFTKDGNLRLVFSKGGQAVGTTTTNPQLYITTYNGAGWSTPAILVNSPTNGDQHASVIQDRNGTIWVFWARIQSGASPSFVLFNKYSIDNGATWSTESQMTFEGSGLDSQQPAAVQENSPTGVDKSIHVFYSSDRNTVTFDYDIYQLVSPSISPVHDLRISPYNVYVPNLFSLANGDNNGYYAGGRVLGASANLTVNFIVQNLGDSLENARATVTISNTTSIPLGTQTTQIPAGSQWTFVFNWNTTVTPKKYNVSVSVTETTSSETVGNSADNSVNLKNAIHLIPWGDADLNGFVNITDAGICYFDFGAQQGSTRYNPFCDIVQDASDIPTPNINIVDVSILARNYGMNSN